MIDNTTLKNVSSKVQESLLKQGESGMGYQLIDDQTNDRSPKLILNGEFSVYLSEVIEKIDSIMQFSDGRLYPLTSRFPSFQPLVTYLEGLSKEDLREDALESNIRVAQGILSSTNIPTTGLPPFTYFTKRGDEFFRLSAFKNDKRILSDGQLVPGTYGTTSNDLKVVTSGGAAVGRYALPSRVPATYLFKIIPDPGTPVFFGTVIPNYGLCGGGVEVYFPNGCGKGSASLIGTIPEF